MKRKTLFFLLGLLFLVPLSLHAYDFKSGDLYYNITSSKAPYTVAVTYETSSSSENYSGLTKAVIPEKVTYNGNIYAVTSIGNSAFDGCASLASVTIPESVASIGSSAFYSCSALTSITLPEGVMSIDNATFRDCSSLTSITIPEAVTNIGYSAFRGCAGLTSITIPKNVTSIGDYAFDGCIGLTSIIWNAKHCADHSSNKNAPFYGINKLLVTSFIFGNEVEHIPADLCSYMSSLISITIPKSVASVGHGAFRDCSGLVVNYTGSIADWCPIQFASGDANPLCNTHKLYINGVDALDEILNIPEGVTCIGNNAFAGCTGLTSVTIPKSVTTIGEGSFRDCSGITSIALAEGISSLEDYAFSGCSGLTSISIPHSITGMGKYAFSGCKSLNSVTIGNSVTSIGNNAFYDCTGLTSVVIGNSVTSIGDNAFYDCTHLQKITMPESVTSIGSSAFYGCSGLTSITIPENVTSIERSAFSGCSGLTSITIPHNVTSIGENAFSGCSGLTSITIPENVTSIERYAFSGCSGLISVIWNATHCADPSSSNYAPFDDPIASQLSSFTFGDNVEHIPAWLCFRTDFTSITMPKNLKTIGTGAFQWSAITSIILPEGVASIGNNAFFGCYNLASVTIPNGVTRIGSEAFYNCSEVPVLVVPNSVTEIGADAFLDVPIMVYGGNAVGSPWGANSVLGESLLSGWLLFEDEAHTILMQCLEDAKGDIVIPETVTTIRDNAFFARQGITSVTIPNSVTHIGDYAFYACKGVFSITIPDDVAEIGEWAFGSVCNIQYNGTATGAPWGAETMGGYIEGDLIYDSEQKTTVIKCNPVLTGEIVLPESVTSIEREAFFDCAGLTSITIPESVTTIGYNAFYNCTGLLSVTIPESVTSIEGYAFYNVNNIVYSGTATGSPWGAKSMNGYVEGLLVYESAEKTKLVGCSTAAAGEIVIPVSVTHIGDRAFAGCSGITAVTIPESVLGIGKDAFSDCSALTSVTVPSGVTSIEENTFSGCSNLTSIIIPDGVTTIGSFAFNGCRGISSITIPNNVTSIGEYAFGGCLGLTSIIIPETVMSIGSNAFSYCNGLTQTIYTGGVAGWCNIEFGNSAANPVFYSENLYINNANLTYLVVPDGVTSIGDYAFYNCRSLNSISIPESVVNIGAHAFDKTLWFDYRGNGVIYINKVLYGYKGAMPENTTIVVNPGTLSISSSAFYDYSELSNIILPNSITSIGDAAFSGCSGLTSITIPESVTSIGAYAFSDCYGLTSITLPEKITTINERTFSDCTDLTSVIIPDSVTTIGNYAFSNCSGLTSVIIPDSVTAIGDYVFENCSNLASFTIGNNLTSMGSGVFSNCPALTSITWNAKNYITKWYISPFHSIASQITSFMFGKDVDSIPNSLCENMTNLTSVIIPGNVKKIGVETFWMCRGLTSVTLENGVTNIGGSAFYNCSGLTSITIPNSVTSIGYQAFDGCSGLTSVSIGKNVTRIEDNAFRDCVGLTSITIPESVIDMGCAFYGCTGLTSVTWNAKNCNGWSDRYYAPFFIYGAASPITSFTFGEEVECIPDYLCYGMEKLTSITIPKSVTRIESDAFAGCTGLTSVTWNAKNCSGWSAYYEAPPLLGLPITSFTFGEEVESIPDYLCYGMQTLTSVTIPKSVLRMGASAFDECTGLTKTNYTGDISEWCNIQFGAYANPVFYSENLYINDVLLTDLIIPDGVTSIGKDAFGSCKSLTSITIPASLINIGEAAFASCTEVTSITSEATNPPSCGEFTFYDVPTTIPVYVPCRGLNGYQSAVGWSRFANIEEPEFYELYLQTADAAMGTVQFDQEFECSSAMAYFSATANEGYHFTQWSDGNTDNPRVLTLTQDSVLIAEFALTQYTLTAVANDAAFGEVTGSTTADYLAEIALSAVANYGYHFVQWSDGNTDNPRMVTLMSDTSLIAEFVPNQYALIIDVNDFALGTVTGGTAADYLTELTISATPNIGCHFAQWSDGNTDNPRTVVLTQDSTFTAEFALSYSGKCGDNLYWAYNDGEISITGTGDMYNYTADTQPWILLRENIKTISICNTATSVGENAFRGTKALSALYIGSEVQNIGANAFVDSRRLYNIYCYPSMPPIAETSSFVNYNVYIYAPCESLFDYQMDAVFGSFKYIQCIGADDVDVIKDEVTVVSDINKATFTWPTDDSADSYSLVISKDDVVFCTLVFNANGQLQSLAFKPSRNPQTGSQHRMQTAEMTNGGLRFTVTGLDEDSHHTFNLTVKDAAQNVLHTYEGEFTTLSSMPTAIEQTSRTDVDAIQKIIRDGQVFILRNGKAYTLTGQEIR